MLSCGLHRQYGAVALLGSVFKGTYFTEFISAQALHKVSTEFPESAQSEPLCHWRKQLHLHSVHRSVPLQYSSITQIITYICLEHNNTLWFVDLDSIKPQIEIVNLCNCFVFVCLIANSGLRHRKMSFFYGKIPPRWIEQPEFLFHQLRPGMNSDTCVNSTFIDL